VNLLTTEFYETPDPFTRWLFARVPKITGRLFEPCCGDKAIVRASGRSEWKTSDIDPRWCKSPMDATTRETWIRHELIDWTVTNPPFSLAIPILERALYHSLKGVAMYLRVSIHEPLKEGARRTFFAQHRPTGILFLPRFAHQRSKTTGKWTTDSATTCWVVWIKQALVGQEIDYAPESVMDELAAYTPSYREHMDALMDYRGTEAERQAQCVSRWKLAA